MAKNINQSQIERLQQLLRDTGAKKVELAKFAQVSPQAVNNWFKYGHVSKDAAQRIATALNLSVDWLLYGESSEVLNHQSIRRINLGKWFAEEIPEKERTYIQELISGESPLTYKVARRLESDYGMPYMHLDSGDENLLNKSPELSPDEKKLIEYYQQFPESTKKEMLRLFKDKADGLDMLFNELKKIRDLK